MKKNFSTELCYVLGLLLISLGISFTQRANFGMSMVVAPSYLIHLQLSEYWPWFTFGMSEYCFQGLLIIILCIVLRKFKIKYLLSFLTAFIHGLILDLFIFLISFIPHFGMFDRVLSFILGTIFTCVGVAFIFNTYLAPEAYELFIMEVNSVIKKKIKIVKTIFDSTCCLLAIILSFVFMGKWNFEVVGVGTLIGTLLNGSIVGIFDKQFKKLFNFKDYLPIRRIFE